MKQTKARRRHIKIRKVVHILEPLLFMIGFMIIFAVAGTSDYAALTGDTTNAVHEGLLMGIGILLMFISTRVRAIAFNIERRMR